MEENYNMYYFNYEAKAEIVINSQIDELKTEIAYLISEMEKISHGPYELDFTEGRVSELNYQINKLKSQLERLTKEDES